MRKRLPILMVWFAFYAALIFVGSRFGFRSIVFPELLVLFLPPFCFCIRATRGVLRRTKSAFPDQWRVIHQSRLKMELREYLFDDRTFGDRTIADCKSDLRWWMKAGILALCMFVPTLLLVEWLAK